MTTKTIAFDISSGDRSYKEPLSSAIKFAKNNPDYKLILFAQNGSTMPNKLPSNIEVVFCEKRVEGSDGPMDILRNSTSTLAQAVEYVKDGKANAIVSAASSGALVGIGYIKFKAINDKVKPVFAPIYCNYEGKPRLMVDAGANITFNAQTLHKYAIMGIEFSIAMGFSTNPKVTLLNIGSEETKGDELRLETFKLLKEDKNINFIGNVEADHIMIDELDVIVADAVTGNILVKSYEAILRRLIFLIKQTKKSFFGKIGLLLTKKKLLNELKKMMNEEVSGGAVVLGLNEIMIKAHGNSNDREFYNSLTVASKAMQNNLIANLKEKLK